MTAFILVFIFINLIMLDCAAIKVRVLSTELAGRLQLDGIYLLEIKNCDMCVLDYVSMAEINRWPFKYIRRYIYLLS